MLLLDISILNTFVFIRIVFSKRQMIKFELIHVEIECIKKGCLVSLPGYTWFILSDFTVYFDLSLFFTLNFLNLLQSY